jgi:hypothetical protein
MEGFLEYVRHLETENSFTIVIITDDTPSEPIQINKGLITDVAFFQ